MKETKINIMTSDLTFGNGQSSSDTIYTEITINEEQMKAVKKAAREAVEQELNINTHSNSDVIWFALNKASEEFGNLTKCNLEK